MRNRTRRHILDLNINDLSKYDGTTTVMRSEVAERRRNRVPSLAAERIAHSFRGCTLRTLLGLEYERKASTRYPAIRAGERAYV